MNEAPGGDEVKSLRLLRHLVTTLTVVMIVGFIILIGFLVTRFPSGKKTLDMPASITLPDGTVPVAFTQTATWYAVVTEADTILIFDRASGKLRQTIKVTKP